jgi:hypothetical protein
MLKYTSEECTYLYLRAIKTIALRAEDRSLHPCLSEMEHISETKQAQTCCVHETSICWTSEKITCVVTLSLRIQQNLNFRFKLDRAVNSYSTGQGLVVDHCKHINELSHCVKCRVSQGRLCSMKLVLYVSKSRLQTSQNFASRLGTWFTSTVIRKL